MASHMIMKCRSGAISRINKHIRSPKVVAKAELLTGQPLQFAPILEFVILRSEQQEQVRGFSRITTQLVTHPSRTDRPYCFWSGQRLAPLMAAIRRRQGSFAFR
jgi:hypothetical protein